MVEAKDETLNRLLSLIQKSKEPSYYYIACKHAVDENNYNLYLYAYGGFICQINYKNGACKSIKLPSIKNYKDHYPEGKLDDPVGISIAERIFFLEEKWEAINIAYNNRAGGIKPIGDIKSKKYMERMRETQIAHVNSHISINRIAFIDMEHNNPKDKAKADLIGVLWDGQKFLLLLTEYKCTYGALANLGKHYKDMASVIDDKNSSRKFKESNLQSLKNMIRLGLVTADEDIEKIILSLCSDQVGLGVLFLFSDRKDMYKKRMPTSLKNGYKQIWDGIKGKHEDMVFHLYIPDDAGYKIDANKEKLKKFLEDGGFDFGM